MWVCVFKPHSHIASRSFSLHRIDSALTICRDRCLIIIRLNLLCPCALFFYDPLRFPGVLLYRPLQSLSVIAMDSVFALCEISLEFISKLWTSNKCVCFGLNALRLRFSLWTPSTQTIPFQTGNGSRILTRRSTVVSSLADLQLSPLKREADKWLNIYGGVGVVFVPWFLSFLSCHILKLESISASLTSMLMWNYSAKMMCSGLFVAICQ